MRRLALLAFLALGLVSCKTQGIAIVAHRGFWKCEAGQYCENSLASLQAAIDSSFWGSEFDVRLTADDVPIIWHDANFARLNGRSDPADSYLYDSLLQYRFTNGEKIPTLDEYLAVAEKAKGTMLVLEFKEESSPEREELLVRKCVESLKSHGLMKPRKVMFISFSKHICDLIAKDYPRFGNQYLRSDIAPADLAKDGINGIDYYYPTIREHPDWIQEAHDHGMTVNVWTMDVPAEIQDFIHLGVDCITTNIPSLTRDLLIRNNKKELH